VSLKQVSSESGSLTRRQEIVETSAELFATRGFDRTSLSEIAVAVGAAKSSIYHYFTSKDQLLAAVLEEGISGLLADALRVVANRGDPVSTLRELLRLHGANFERKLAHLTVYLTEGGHSGSHLDLVCDYRDRRHAYDRLFVELLQRGQSDGQIIEGDPQVMTYGILGMFNWMVQWYRVDGRVSVPEIVNQFETMAMRAVLVQPEGSKLRRGSCK